MTLPTICAENPRTVSILFQSLRSSSRGNCLLLRSDATTVLIDCGFSSQREFDDLIDRHVGLPDAVIVSHCHGDHVSYSALRCLGRRRVPLHSHQQVIRYARQRHVCCDWEEPPHLLCFSHEPFEVGDFVIQPVKVPHAPECDTYGFVVHYARRGMRKKIVVCTDFHDWSSVLEHFLDADFIFVESNHDPDLLRRYPNFASHFHLPNGETAALLYEAVGNSQAAPQMVMLGHLSEQRNTERLALDAVRDAFAWHNMDVPFPVVTAPRYTASKPFVLAE